MLYQVIEDKIDMASENIEKALRYAGKAMQCIEEMRKDPGSMGERRGVRYGNRYGRMGMREDGMMPDDDVRAPGNMGMRDGMGYRDPYYY